MQLYHHAFSLNSQKVRLALEEKNLDYTSHSLNPIKGMDLNSDLFTVNPDGKMPVFKNGSLVLTDTLAIIQFIDRVNQPLGGDEVEKEKMQQWMQWIHEWEPKLFTLSHIPPRIRTYFGRFKRRVAIARMAENPNLASKFHSKLHNAYATDEMMKDAEALEANKRQLQRLLDMAEEQLTSTKYLAGDVFSMADVMFIPVLGWLELLGLHKEYIYKRNKLSQYWSQAKRRKSYRVVIGRYFGGLNKYKTFFTNFINVSIRDIIHKY